MKIMLLGMTKIMFMPYLKLYLDQIDLSKNEVYVIHWDRDGQPDVQLDSRIKTSCMREDADDFWPLHKKIPGFLKFRRFAKYHIKIIKPDVLVVPYSTTAVLLYDTLLKKYRKKYIFDFRDVTYEHLNLFRKAVHKIVGQSIATFVSSDGFRQFLPTSDKLYTVHNLSISNGLNREIYKFRRNREQGKPIQIAYWGLIRPYSVTKALIDRLGNDPRFELHYYGRAQGEIKQLLEQAEQDCDNVFFHGVYKPEDRDKFALTTDILFNAFDKNDCTMPYAMSNKYYDGAVYYLPQLCTEGSFMGKLVREKQIGIAIDPFSSTLGDEVFQFAMSYDREAFFQACDMELERVFNDISQNNEVIRSILGEKNE